MTTTDLAAPRVRTGTAVVLIVLVALNLRPAITVVGPVVTQIQSALHLSDAAAGALTTMPLFFFGSFGLVAPFLRRRPAGEWLLTTSMGLLVVAMLIRVIPSTAALFAGSLLAGIGISIGNVAVPAIIKRDHPEALTMVTAIYTVAVTGGAAVASGVALPLEHLLGTDWRGPLGVLAVPAVVAGLFWLPRIRHAPAATPAPADAPRVWRSGLAWQITVYMGLQSLLAYVVIAWLPTIGQDRGMTAAGGGYVTALVSIFQAVGALVVPLVARRLSDQRPLVVAVTILCVVGLVGVEWAPLVSIWGWAVILGTGQGIAFASALSFMGLRAADSHVAGQLSGMAQGIGYMIAALGPLGVGVLHQVAHGWSLPVVMVLVVIVGMTFPGLGAARNRFVR